jgi:long-subunit fatty acid transport protein
MKKYYRVLAVFLPLPFVCAATCAQNMNSPYSIYGVGDIDYRAYNRTGGMASTGIALSSSFYLIDNNPASITGLPRSFYVVDVNTVGKSVQYKGDPITSANNDNKDFWIKRFDLAVKLNKSWASGIGIRQFSNVNYRFTGSKQVEGATTTYLADYDGDGGLNEYYWNNAVAIGRHFSFGLKSSIIAGSINQTETVSDANLQSVVTAKQQDYIGQARFQFGALYKTALSKKWDASVGARFTPKTNMVSERTLTVSETGTALLQDEFIKYDRFHLPATFAAGIALKHNKRTTFAFDYSYEDWSSLSIRQHGWEMISSQRLSGGVEFSKQQYVGKELVERRYFQIGAFYNSASLRVRGQPINEYGVTAGMGGAVNGSLLYSLSVEAGTRGTSQAGLIKENFLQVTLGFTFRDFLFSKGRKYN